MVSPRSDELSSFFRRLVDRLFGLRKQSRRSKAASVARNLRFESLEGRALLATDLATITGIVSRGAVVSGATIDLYQDDGDAVFEPGTDDGLVDTTTTDGAGQYTFDRLSAGDYWVQQPAQTAGAIALGQFVSPIINITALEAQGVAGTSIDDFSNAIAQNVAADSVTTTDADAADYVNALGGERDLFVQFTSGGAGESISLDSQAARLLFSSTTSAQGLFTATYDGNDNDATTLDETGLGGLDLTDGGQSNSIQARVRADQANATLSIRIYSDAVSYSDSAIFTVPGTNTDVNQVFEFADFAQGAGASAPADFTNVGAIVATITTTTDGTDGRITLLGAFGPTVETQNITNQADLSLTKVVDNPSPGIGQNVVYTLTITNGGTAGATNVAVTDVIPAGMSFSSSNASQGTYSNASSIWTVGDLAVGATATLDITAAILTAGAKLNTGEITASDQPDPDSTPNNGIGSEDDIATATTTPTQIDLSLTKTVDDNTPDRNQNITFTVTVSNAGPNQATGVVVNDLLPAGLTFVSSSPSQGSYVSGTGVWTVGAINSGASATLQIVAAVATSTVKVNTAQVTAAAQTDVDSTPNNNVPTEDDQASQTITPNIADLSVSKTVDDNTPDKNQNVTFTVTVANAGPAQATNVAVTDLLPAGLTFVSSTPSQGSYVSGTGVWTVGSINSGANATLQIVATVITTGAKVNTAELTAADPFDPDSTPGNNLASEDDQASQTVTPNVADLSLTKTVNDNTPDRNQNVTFSLTVSNAGPINATGITVSDVLPSGLTFVSSTPSQGSFNSGTGVWTVGAVNNGASATLQIVATVTTIGLKTNTAEVAASNQFDPDSTPANNQAAEDDQASAAVTPNVADLSVTKTVDEAAPDVGDNVVFTITVSNTGPIQATNVALTDALPASLTFVSSTPSQGTYSSGTGVWTVGTINSGANATLQITATVTTTGAKVNTAEVSASDQFDPDSTPGNAAAGEDDQASATVTPPSDFTKRRFLARTAETTTPGTGFSKRAFLSRTSG